MASRHTYKGVTWVDLENPTPADVRTLMNEFDLHPLIGEELLSSTVRSKAERYDNSVYVILHFPRHTHEGPMTREVDFIIGRTFIITVRYAEVESFYAFTKAFEVGSSLNNESVEHGGIIFSRMLHSLYHALNDEAETISARLQKIEEIIFEGREKEMVARLSSLSRVILTFKAALFPHHDVLRSFEEHGKAVFGDAFGHHARALQGEHSRVSGMIEKEREFLSELRETNNSLLTTKQNEVIKNLTMMSFVTFPLVLLSGIFSMQTKNPPIVGHEGDFWIIVGLMLAIAAVFFFFFKYKRWL